MHDSPDYFQLKVSLFNDDKKTEIIGETWVNLQEVIVPGGGQNDIWHNLSYRGKYAGEIRIEITYYDTRPKEEKTEKIKQISANGVEEGARDSLRGPRQPKAAPLKRRPLPSDPITGAPALEPIEQTPLRSYQQPTAVPDHVQTPPRGYPSPSAIPSHVQPSSRGYQSPNYVSSQSPLQNVEYNTPLHHHPQSHGYAGSPNINGYATSPSTVPVSPMPSDEIDFSQGRGIEHYGGQEESNDPYNYDIRQPVFDMPEAHEFMPSPSLESHPPPPPVHRSMNGSQQVSPMPVMKSRGSYNFPPVVGTAHQYDARPHNPHRQSMPTMSAYSNSDFRDTHELASDDQFRKSAGAYEYEQSGPRHNSYDSRYNGNHASMQPTVEDAPPTPGPPNHPEQYEMGSRGPQFDERQFDHASSPAPLNLSGRGGAPSAYSHHQSNSSAGYGPVSPVASFSGISQTISSLTSYNAPPPQNHSQGRKFDDRPPPASDNYGVPQMPPSLVPGMDPTIAQEITDRIYAENRAGKAASSPRARFDSPRYQPPMSNPVPYQQATIPSTPLGAAHDGHQGHFAAGTSPSASQPRGVSPDTRTPTRKSLSPSPGASPDARRLSGVPFGPDSYNALNPVLAASTSTTSLSARYDTKVVDPDAKIIMHDGREVDPSDHIPESNYAPLLESRGPKYASQQPDRNYRPPPPAQADPSPGRKVLRQAGRPQSMAASSPIHMNNNPPEPSTPTGRHRLQKKSHRMSAQPAPHSSPLAPITPYQNNAHTPRSLPRGNAGDYPNENYAPQTYGSSPGYRGSTGPPPIPAKVPVNQQGPPLHANANGGDAWALLEEMKNIDLGSGRARRRY